MMTNRKKTMQFVDVAQVLLGRHGNDKWMDGKLKTDGA